MYWIGQKVHSNFLMEKPKWTFWPTQEFPGSDKILSLSLFASFLPFQLRISTHAPSSHGHMLLLVQRSMVYVLMHLHQLPNKEDP